MCGLFPFYSLVDACLRCRWLCFFFFNDTATTEIYTLSLHDALPIYSGYRVPASASCTKRLRVAVARRRATATLNRFVRSEEHTSELQSPCNLVCRLLLEKKKYTYYSHWRMCCCGAKSASVVISFDRP